MYTRYYGILFPTGILSDLERGNSLRKLRRQGGQIHDYKRTFKLDRTQDCITREGGSASRTIPHSSNKIFISQIKEVLSGHHTDIYKFERWSKPCLNKEPLQ